MGHAKTKGLLLAFFFLLATPSSALAAFGVSTFTIAAREADGTVDAVAASHPFALDFHLAMNQLASGQPDGALRAIQVDLPSGLLGNTSAVPRCELNDFDGGDCDGATQVGVLRGVVTGLGRIVVPVYNLAPSPGYAAALGGLVSGMPLVERLTLLGAGVTGSIRLAINLPTEPAIIDIEEEIWGVPADPGHDPQRTCRGEADRRAGGCAIGEPEPFLTLPASCAEPMRATLTATSYGPSPVTAVATAVSRDAGGNAQVLIGCEAVPFQPRFSAATEAAALAPTGLTIGVGATQYEGTRLTGAAPVAALEIALPEGMVLNPSAGSWLSGCSPAQIGLESAPGVEPPAFDSNAAVCPAGARLGSVRLRTPLIGHELSGAVYLAKPVANPSGARYAIYLVIEDAVTGTVLKIPGRLDADPADGRLTATVPELPALPLDELELELSGGPRAILAAPPSCGRYATRATFTPSAAPFTVPVGRASTFTISTGAGGAPCPPPESARNAVPSFSAGTKTTRAGGDSPLVISLAREDLDQHFGSFQLTLPPGLLADLGSVPVGAAVGSVRVKAGLGPQPLDLPGTVYLGGPYEGAPYSLEFVVPGRAGPFDFGTIVVRAAVAVDPETAQVSVRSGPLPRILDGVPLQLRGISIDLDRPGFIRNPTSCEPMAIGGAVTSTRGQVAPLSARFQVGDCGALAFRPKLSLRFSGAVGRNGHPALRAVLRGDPEGAALAGARFTLPGGELLDLRHVRRLCPRAVGAGECPPASRLGSLRLQSPSLGAPLSGPVYLRAPRHRLPGLSAEVRSGDLHFILHGRVTRSKHHLGVALQSLPDVPLSRATLTLAGGRRGILVNSRSLCRRIGRVTANLAAHNGRHRRLRVRPRRPADCPASRKRTRHS